MAKRKYWYELYIQECPVCGQTRKYRERRYTKRPIDGTKRIHFEQFWCGQECQG